MSPSSVFISYARNNAPFVRKLVQSLEAGEEDNIWVDWEDIPPSSPSWWNEIEAGIESTDTLIFVMSSASLTSVICNLELAYALALQMRIIPIVIEDPKQLDSLFSNIEVNHNVPIPKRFENHDIAKVIKENRDYLREPNWIPLWETEKYGEGLSLLLRALETNLSYVKSHTRYKTRAAEWVKSNRSKDLLLFGGEIRRAEDWLLEGEKYANSQTSIDQVDVVNPKPTKNHHDYITASRRAQHWRAWITRSGGLSLLVTSIALLFLFADTQRQIARGESRIISLNLAGDAIEALNDPTVDPNVPALLAIRALRTTYTEQADAALIRALDGLRQRVTLRGWLAQEISKFMPLSGQTGDEGVIALANGRVVNWRFSPSDAGDIHLFSPDGELLHISTEDVGIVRGALALPDGRFVTWGDLLALWNADAVLQDTLASFTGYEVDATGAALLPDGSLIAWWGDSIQIWNNDFRPPLQMIGHDERVGYALELANGNIVSQERCVNPDCSPSLKLWNENGDFLRELSTHFLRELSIERFYFWPGNVANLPDNRIIAWAHGGGLLIWDLDGQPLGAIDRSPTQGLFQHPDGRILFWDNAGSLYLWNVEDLVLNRIDETLQDLQMIPELSNGNFLSWNRDFVDATQDPTNRSTTVGQVIYADDGIALVLPDERLITRAADNTFQLRNPDGQVIRTYQGHTGPVYGVRLLRDGRLLSWSDDQTLRFWQVDVEESIDYACTRVFRDFTDEERSRYNIPPGATCPQFAR